MCIVIHVEQPTRDRGKEMKTYKKYGSCKNKHSINVIQKNIKDYFIEMGVTSKNELDEMVQEALLMSMQDGQEACEFARCDK